jgi:hypothetical protein
VSTTAPSGDDPDELARWVLNHFKGNKGARDAYLARYASTNGRPAALELWERMKRIYREQTTGDEAACL